MILSRCRRASDGLAVLLMRNTTNLYIPVHLGIDIALPSPSMSLLLSGVKTLLTCRYNISPNQRSWNKFFKGRNFEATRISPTLLDSSSSGIFMVEAEVLCRTCVYVHATLMPDISRDHEPLDVPIPKGIVGHVHLTCSHQ